MELYFPDLAKNYSKILALYCLESLAHKKGVHLEKKEVVKKISTRNINLQLAKFNFKIISF